MIIGLLLGTAIYKLRGNVEVSRIVAVQSSLQSIRTQLKLYESFNGAPPTTDQGLNALVTQPRRRAEADPLDAVARFRPEGSVGQGFIYLSPGPEKSERLRSVFVGAGSNAGHGGRQWGN